MLTFNYLSVANYFSLMKTICIFNVLDAIFNDISKFLKCNCKLIAFSVILNFIKTDVLHL